MRWIDRLERRFGRYGIPNLMNLILIGQITVWVLVMFINQNLYPLLTLQRSALLHGEVWRLISFIFVPDLQTNLFWFALTMYFYWWLGNSLENAWGDFRFLVYWLVGMAGAILSCLLMGSANTSGLFLSLFFAYAWMWPNQQILLFFILPIKVKWLGWISAAFWVVAFVMDLFLGNFAGALCLVFGVAGFLAFFGPELWIFCRDAVRNFRRRQQWKRNNR